MNEFTPRRLDPTFARTPDKPTPLGSGRVLLPPDVVAQLSSSVRRELAQLPAASQSAFLRKFQTGRKNLVSAYLRLLTMTHYGYLGRWDVSVLMFVVSIITLGAVGSIWWMVDAYRMPSLVRAYNTGLAIDILREVKSAPQSPERLRYY